MPAEASGTGRGQAQGGQLPWSILVLTLAAVTSSSLSALSLYHVLALQAEVEGLRSEVGRRREEQSGASPGETTGGAQPQQQQRHTLRDREESLQHVSTSPRPRTKMDSPERQQGRPNVKKRSLVSESVLQPCLQMMADSKRSTFQKEFALVTHTGIPWQAGLTRGSALEEHQDAMLVKEEGFFFVYSQVYYTDTTYAMGHIVIRRKRNVVGDESQHVILFRCIQNMNPLFPYNTCYTGGIVKLEVGDRVELLIPRSTASVSLEGDSTFLGAVKLG